jgi:signal peptidase II
MPKTNNSITSKLYLVGGIVALILVLDQALKIYIKTHFQPGEEVSVFGNWFVLEYIENQGMAFGTTFGNKMWHKLALSVFRIVAIGAICYYWWKQAKQGARTEFLLAIGLILAGATGNLIDSMFYDFVFPYDPCISFNHLKGSGIQTDCGVFGQIETRHTGFLLGNVVDMFKFHAVWPSWMPLIGNSEVFPAIWNVADSAISVGVGMVFIRQRTYFKKDEKNLSTAETVVEESEGTPKSEL